MGIHTREYVSVKRKERQIYRNIGDAGVRLEDGEDTKKTCHDEKRLSP